MRSAAVELAPSGAERRNFQRVRVKVYGRFMLEDRTEHPCQVVDMSPGNVALRTDRVKKDKLAAQLTWLANKHELDLPEDRRHERAVPRNPKTVLQLGDGRHYQCRIIDLSLSGAAIEIDVKPAIGVQVMLGTMRGQVVRHFEDGIAIEFATVQRVDSLDSEFNAPRS